MAKWNKVIVSGSNAHLRSVTASNGMIVSSSIPFILPQISSSSLTRALVIDTDGKVYKASADFGTSTLALQTGEIYVGDGGTATARTLRGDATIDANGSLLLSGSAIETKTTLSGGIANDDQSLLYDSSSRELRKVSLLDIKNYSNVGQLSTTLNNGQIFVGNGSNVATGVTPSGDVTITNTGVTSLSNTGVVAGTYGSAVNVAQITVDAKGRITTASNVAISGVSPVGSTLNSANIWVGNASNQAAAVAMSGEGTLSNAGVFGLTSTAISNKTTQTSLLGTEEVLINDSGTLKKTTLNSITSANRTGSFTGSFSGSFNGNIAGGANLQTSYIWVGDVSNKAQAVAMSGHVFIGSNGSTSLSSFLLADGQFSQYSGQIAPSNGEHLMFFVGSGSSLQNRKFSYNQLTASLSSSFASMNLFGGDKVGGPGSSTDNAIARWDGTTGRLIQNSGVIIDDSNNITGVVNFTNTGNTTLGDTSGDTLTVNATSTFVNNVRMNQNLIVDGDLTVSGNTTTLNVDNLIVEDKFILLASGSTFGTDSGIVMQQNSNGTGVVMGYDASEDRFAVQTTFNPTGSLMTPEAYVGLVEVSTTDPSPAPLFSGGTTEGVGTIHINTTTGDIFIWS